jgi:predicted permease
MESLFQDLRFAVRTLLRSRGFAVVAILCLGLGVGVNTAVFSMVNALLIRPFPFHEPDRVVTLYGSNARLGYTESGLSHADLADWKAGSRGTIEELAAFYTRSVAVAGPGETERVEGASVETNTFGLLGMRPVLGRSFLPEEGISGGPRVVLLSDALWRRRFAADPHVVGRKVVLNGAPAQIVGVMPPRFKFPEVAELWTPLAPDPTDARGERYLGTVARLRPGATIRQAEAELAAVARRLAAEYPETNSGWGARVVSYRDDMIDGSLRLMLSLMLGAVGLVLLIACANVANLMLARSAGRRREIAVRSALGAGRARVFRQLLTESVVLALAGGALGTAIAIGWTKWTVSRIPEELPYWIRFEVDGTVLAFTFLLSSVTGVVFGAIPALRATGGDVQQTLRDGGRGASGGRSRLRSVLVVGQLSLALVLLVGATLMIRSFVAASRADLGFDTSHVLTARVYLAGDRYTPRASRAAFLNAAAERISAIPGVQAAAATNAIPGDDGGQPVELEAEGAPRARGDELTGELFGGTAGLWTALGTPLAAGRPFTAAESGDTAATAAIVSQELAKRLWPNGDAMGRRLRLADDGGEWLTVVGIARNLHYEEVGEATPRSRLQLFLPAARLHNRTYALLVRTEGDPAPAAAAVRREMRALDATLPTFDVRTMDEVRRYVTWPQQLWASLFGSFGTLALVLAAVGVYGVMAYTVSQRTREIGIRIALGARGADIVRRVVGEGAVLTAAGVGLGMLGALGAAQLMRGALYGVAPVDPVAFLAIPLLLASVALLASWLPARRASRVDPMVALRAE